MSEQLAKQRTFEYNWSSIDPTVAVIESLAEIEDMGTEEFLEKHGTVIRNQMDMECVESVTEEPGFVALCVRFPLWKLTFRKSELEVKY